MSTSLTFGKDDIFILGNIAANAVLAGRGNEAESILNFIQVEREKNPGAYVLRATHLYASGQLDEAISLLDDDDMFDVEVNGAEAFAFFLILLKEKGDYQRIIKDAGKYRAKHPVLPESARHAIDTILAEIGAQAPKTVTLN